MLGDFIIEHYLDSKLRILQGKGTELDKINVEVNETLFFPLQKQYDVKVMLEEVKIPKLDANIPISLGNTSQ